MKTKILAVLAVLVLPACGGGAIPYESLQSETNKVECRKFTECGAFSSETACQAWVANAIASAPDFYAARIKSGKVLYDGARAKSCLDEISKATCDSFLAFTNDSGRTILRSNGSAWSSMSISPDCRLAFQGTVKAGEACTNGVECTPDTYCAMSIGCSGMCVKRLALNGHVITDAQCVTGLVPVGHAPDATCQMPLTAGAACMQGDGNGCDPVQNLYCGSSQVCQKYRSEAETCDDTQRCGTLLTCASGHCARFLPVSTSCDSPSTRPPVCQIGLHCEPGSWLCAQPVGEGAACGSSMDCQTSLVCAGAYGAMKCTKPATENQSCSICPAGPGCRSAPCDTTTYCETLTKICKKRIAAGQPCTPMPIDSCASQSYCDGSTCTALFCQ